MKRVEPIVTMAHLPAESQHAAHLEIFAITCEEHHPYPKRLLMPEKWQGWQLRKDYVQPDFHEMQDSY